MKPADFEYHRFDSSAGALAATVASHGACRFIAGGQTLGPMMNLRLARPTALIDISKAADLLVSSDGPDSVIFGSAITHAQIEDGCHPDPVNGAMRRVAAGIAYRVVRNRGTIGGSVAHADPGADWLSFLTVSNATIHVAGPDSARRVPIGSFVLSAYTTTLSEDELIVAVEVPRYGPAARFGYYKLCRKVGEFADAIGTALIDPDQQYCRVVAGAIGAGPIVLDDAAKTVARTAQLPTRESLEQELHDRDPHREPVRLRMAAVAVRRAVQEALAKVEPTQESKVQQPMYQHPPALGVSRT